MNPASEFPTVTGREVIPIVAEVRKWGAKGWISDEARDRNDSSLWTNELRRMSNVPVRAVGLSSREIFDQGLNTGRVSGRADRLGHPGADPRRFRA